VNAAASLMYEQGVHATSVDDVLAASGTGKSQLYHYFSSKEDLVVAVLDRQLEHVLRQQDPHALESWKGLRDWFDELVRGQERRGWLGCPLGSLAAQVIDQDGQLRTHAAEVFERWEASLAAAFQTMRDRGTLRSEADPEALAETVMASIQGGYLLSSAKRHARPLANSLSSALDLLQAHAPSPVDS
jgi:TetR/AcrR family transcriptional repressor of nem operon